MKKTITRLTVLAVGTCLFCALLVSVNMASLRDNQNVADKTAIATINAQANTAQNAVMPANQINPTSEAIFAPDVSKAENFAATNAAAVCENYKTVYATIHTNAQTLMANAGAAVIAAHTTWSRGDYDVILPMNQVAQFVVANNSANHKGAAHASCSAAGASFAGYVLVTASAMVAT